MTLLMTVLLSISRYLAQAVPYPARKCFVLASVRRLGE
jgi:hypothetical protein